MIVLLSGLLIISFLSFFGIIFLFLRGGRNRLDINNKFEQLGKNQERIERTVKEEISFNRKELNLGLRQAREEMLNALRAFEESILARMKDNENSQKNQLDIFSKQLSALTRINQEKLDKMRDTIEERLKELQAENSRELEQVRVIVDEKLHATLERRLGESFKIVSDRLESVYRGLGEMQVLALSVGDLKKVLTNVKVRGIWGEIQLGTLLEQILTPEQYARNVSTKKGSNERVEFAIKLPGRDNNESEPVWLPIDAKFPQEDYQRLLQAQDDANSELVEKAGKQLEIRIKAEAKDIKEKYLDPPYTPDFGLMFLPTEGLYAEVLRRPGLSDTLQREFRVVVTGPTTLAALLNSLQMGFRTLAIEKHSSHVWRLLGVVKNEFSKFGSILDKTKKKLQEATNNIEDVSSKTRNIQTKLKRVQELPLTAQSEVIEEIENFDSTKSETA